MMRRLLILYRTLPRAGRWLVWTGAGMLLYFGLVEPLLDATMRLSIEADRLEARLREVRREGERMRDRAAAVSLGMSRFAQVALPREPDAIAGDLDARINRVLEAHAVTSHTIRARAGRLADGPLSAALAGARIRTIIRDVSFEGAPETLTTLIAEFERAPEVARVTRLELAPADDRATRTLRASITIEAWAVEAEGGGP